MTVIEASLIEHQLFLLLMDGHSLLSVCIISQEMLQILYFPFGNPIGHSLKYWIFPLSSCPISHVQVHTCMGSSSLDGRFLDSLIYLLISLSHHWVMGIYSSCPPHSDSTQDGLHSLCVQLQCKSGLGICGCIVPSLLVFNA